MVSRIRISYVVMDCIACEKACLDRIISATCCPFDSSGWVFMYSLCAMLTEHLRSYVSSTTNKIPVGLDSGFLQHPPASELMSYFVYSLTTHRHPTRFPICGCTHPDHLTTTKLTTYTAFVTREAFCLYPESHLSRPQRPGTSRMQMTRKAT